MPDHRRRGLLRGELLTREGRARVERRVEPLGPWPPGLQAVAEACGDCPGPCQPACPEDIVRFHPLEHRLTGRPYLDFSRAGCTLCGECVEACPWREAVAPRSARAVAGWVRLDPQRCLAWNGILCMSCVGRCEARALALDRRRRLEVDAGRCTGCGGCVSACPVDALAVRPAPAPTPGGAAG